MNGRSAYTRRLQAIESSPRCAGSGLARWAFGQWMTGQGLDMFSAEVSLQLVKAVKWGTNTLSGQTTLNVPGTP